MSVAAGHFNNDVVFLVIVSELQNREFADRLLIAQADTTSADVLAALAIDADARIRQAVVQNPNTSIETLEQLGKEFPDEVVENPIFNILLLEDPESHFIRLALARSSKTDESTLIQLARIKDLKILCAVAQNLRTPISVLEELLNSVVSEDVNYDDWNQLWEAIAQNPNTPESLLIQLAASGDFSVELKIAQHPNVPTALLDQFADWRNDRMHKAIAQNPKTPASILEKLAGEDLSKTRELVKQHPNVSDTAIAIINFVEEKPGTPVELLERLASDRRNSIRRLVAKHPRTPAIALEKLLQDSDSQISADAEKHPNTTSEILEAYAHFLVRQFQVTPPPDKWHSYGHSAFVLTKHPKVTSTILEIVSSIEAPDVLAGVASAPKTPQHLLLKLANYQPQSEPEKLWIGLIENPNTPSEALEILFPRLEQSERHCMHYGNHYLVKIASHPNSPTLLLERLVSHPDRSLRCAVARNLQTPIDVLRLLASDQEKAVVSGVAENENAPLDLLIQLADSDIPIVRQGVAKNLNTPLPLLERLADDENANIRTALATNPNLSPDILNRLAQDQVPSVQNRILTNPSISLELLESLLNNATPETRQWLATRRNLPKHILLKLAEDEDSMVRFNLIKQPNLDEAIIQRLTEATFEHLPKQNALKGIEALNPLNTAFLMESNLLNEIIAHPNTPIAILEDFACTQPRELLERLNGAMVWIDRKAIAQNSKTPTEVLEKLSHDPQEQEDVRNAAQVALKARLS